MENGITFQFKDISKETIFYIASYSTKGSLIVKKRKVEFQRYDPTFAKEREAHLYPLHMIVPKTLEENRIPNGWPIFYKNATFDSILRALSLYEEKRMRNTQDEPDDWLHPYKMIKVKKKNGSLRFEVSEDDGAFLKAIADNPDRLIYNLDALFRFVRILWSAKTGWTPAYIDASQEEIKDMLNKNLIPKHKGGRKYRPQGMRLVRALLKKLADRLSKNCMTFLRTQEFYCGKKDFFAPEQWRDNYSKIIEWGRTHEYRISILNQKRLKDLITNPADYADSLLEESLLIGLRTINTPSSAK